MNIWSFPVRAGTPRFSLAEQYAWTMRETELGSRTLQQIHAITGRVAAGSVPFPVPAQGATCHGTESMPIKRLTAGANTALMRRIAGGFDPDLFPFRDGSHHQESPALCRWGEWMPCKITRIILREGSGTAAHSQKPTPIPYYGASMRNLRTIMPGH